MMQIQKYFRCVAYLSILIYLYTEYDMHNKDIDTSLKAFQYLSSAMNRSVVYEREIFNNFDIFEKIMKTRVTTPLQFYCS